MLFNVIVVSSFLVATASAVTQPTGYMMGRPSENNPFGILRRQSGYQPTETACSPGSTCEESCGPGSQLCDDSSNPDPSFAFYCYNPGQGDTCCSDRSGNSCKAGYYCTDDSQHNTWCCPNGMDLAACQALYTITGSLVSLAPLTSTSSISATTSVSQLTTSTNSASSVTSTSSLSSTNASVTSATNTTVTAGTTIPVFTGAANTQVLYNGLPVLAAGILGLIGVM